MRVVVAIMALVALLSGCGGGGSSDEPQDAKATPLSIKAQPADVLAVEGDPASFSVDAAGAGALSYQWRRNDVPLPGATDKVYTLPAAAMADDGATFSVLVSDQRTTVASAAAQLKVTGKPVAPSIVTPPADQAVFDGDPVSFSVTATGTAPLAYTWQRNGADLPGETSATLTLNASLADHGARFRVIVSNKRGSVTSPEATLSVSAKPAAPVIVTQPADTTVTAPGTATFSAAATGTAPLAYQWLRNGVAIAGANVATYTTPPTTVADSGSTFSLVVSNAVGSAVSSAAVLTVRAAPVAPAITTQPANQTVTEGQTATFSVVATGTAPLTYQWRRNGANITGANASTYTTPATTASADNGARFDVVISNSVGTATSQPATLTVNPLPVAPTITAQPADVSVTEGQTASFSAAATGATPLTFQWRRNGTNITGAVASTYTTPATTASADNGALFDVVVTNAVGSATSRSARLTVTAPGSYLQTLLATTPEGGWVKVNSNSFSEAWPTGADLPPPTPGGPELIIPAWSGFAWDSRRSQLILFGGGHANYVGNEVYVWQGSDGRWTRASLPSRVDLSTSFVVGGAAPQSAHTYQTSSYAPLVDRFVLFGGAAWSSGGVLADATGRTDPWWWDPTKRNANQVGGQDGTGWDPSRLGSNAWQTRRDVPWIGVPSSQLPSFINGTSAYRVENGKDVIYLSMDFQASGWPYLYRYELGTPTTPDLLQLVGGPSWSSVVNQGGAAIDSRNGLFVRTALAQSGGAVGDLAVWRLANNNPASPGSNFDVPVQLSDENGVPVNMNSASSIAYDAVNDQFIIWDSRDRGTVWITRSTFNADGSIAPNWIIRRTPSTTTAQPIGNHPTGVLGKWKYAPELKAFVALDATPYTGDVWLYKPPVR